MTEKDTLKMIQDQTAVDDWRQMQTDLVNLLNRTRDAEGLIHVYLTNLVQFLTQATAQTIKINTAHESRVISEEEFLRQIEDLTPEIHHKLSKKEIVIQLLFDALSMDGGVPHAQ